MKEFRIPYGKGEICCEIPDERLLGVLRSGITEYRPEGTPDELTERAMACSIASSSLCELAKGKKKVVLIASDHTRPVPSRVIVPKMLREIRKGNPEAEITILIATGCHRGTTAEELTAKFGEEIVRNEHIVVHDCDKSEMVRLGVLPSGQPLIVNRLAADADLLVAEGFIEPHFFAGYSGGRKSVLPGVVAREVVLGNHNGAFIDDPHSRTGVLEGNRIHEDMLYAAKKVGLAYIVNVVLNAEHEVIYAVAGDVEKAHEAGCAFLASHCCVGMGGGRECFRKLRKSGHSRARCGQRSFRGYRYYLERRLSAGSECLSGRERDDGCGSGGPSGRRHYYGVQMRGWLRRRCVLPDI